jgi:small subunit ribosomal protein S17
VKRVKAHDENNECKVGDKVMIVESQPLSKEIAMGSSIGHQTG